MIPFILQLLNQYFWLIFHILLIFVPILFYILNCINEQEIKDLTATYKWHRSYVYSYFPYEKSFWHMIQGYCFDLTVAIPIGWLIRCLVKLIKGITSCNIYPQIRNIMTHIYPIIETHNSRSNLLHTKSIRRKAQ